MRIELYKSHIEKIDAVLKEPLNSHIHLIEEMGNYVLLGNGKRFRPLCFVLSTLLCNYKGQDLYQLSTIFEYLHAASLLHDDVLDNANLRRNKSSANKIWGNHASILGGDFLASKSFCIAMNSKNIQFLKRLTETVNCMAEGQILELIHTNDWNTSKEIYMEIINAKTAALISAACSCGAIISESDKDMEQALEEFGRNVGIAFQLIDDLLDYTSSEDLMGKPIGKDLKEGKITLPLIYTLSKFKEDERKRITDIFANCRATEPDYRNLIAFVRMNGVLNRVRNEAQSYIKKAKECLSIFPVSSTKQELLALAQYTIERRY